MLGGRRSGKSTLCNIILNEEVFSTTTTTTTSSSERSLEEIQVLVADTPAIPVVESSERERGPTEIEREISKGILMTSPGPRLVILVIRFDQPKAEVKECMEYIKKYFGKDELG